MGQDDGLDSVAVSEKEAAQIGLGAFSHSSCERARRSQQGSDNGSVDVRAADVVRSHNICALSIYPGDIGTDPTQSAKWSSRLFRKVALRVTFPLSSLS